MFSIREGGFGDPRVADLLHIHVTTAHAQTARDSAHALNVEGLQAPGISFWTFWDDDRLLGFGALKWLTGDHGEVKSMHTAEAARRRGVGSAILSHIIAVARERGLSHLSLETGSQDYFRPPVALYRRHGFVECPPFADYRPDRNSIFMTLDLRRS